MGTEDLKIFCTLDAGKKLHFGVASVCYGQLTATTSARISASWLEKPSASARIRPLGLKTLGYGSDFGCFSGRMPTLVGGNHRALDLL